MLHQSPPAHPLGERQSTIQRRPTTPEPALELPINATSNLTPEERRAGIALVEAMIPGSATIPAADERTLRRAEDMVRFWADGAARPFGMVLRALDLAAVLQTGKPFHALTRERQDSLLHSWEHSPVHSAPLNLLSTLLKFAHFDAEHTYERQGGKFKVVKTVERPRYMDQIVVASDWEGDDTIECDAVVIGTGAGGAVVGRELADRGHAVVFVEEGEHYKRGAYNGSMIRAHGIFYRNALAIGNAPMPTFMGKMMGGSTAVNGGTSLRPPDWVLDQWCESLQTDDFSSENMAPLFERVESVLNVSIPERKYIGPIADIIDRGCDTFGWSRGPIPRNAVGCEGGGFCDFGCSTGAKRSTDISYIPAALERGALALTGLRAERVLQENGRAVGIEGVATNGKKIRIRAKVTVLAGGAIPTPLFLMKNNLCNRSGEVGKNLTLHPSGAVSAVFDEELHPHRYIPQAYLCDEFLRQGVLLSGAQPDLNIGAIMFPFTGQRLMEAMSGMSNLTALGIVLRDTGTGTVRFEFNGTPIVTYSLTPRDVDNMHFGIVRSAELLFAAGARRVLPSLMGGRFMNNLDDLKDFRNAKLRASSIALTSYHPLGTCKMGRDPKKSVVDINHQAHDLPGLFIVDGSTVPSALGVNPQIAIMAMATRAAMKIAETI